MGGSEDKIEQQRVISALDESQNQRASSRTLGRYLFKPMTAGALLLVLMTLIAYHPALRAGFVWDDDAITENMLLRMNDGIFKIWTSPSAIPHESHYWPLAYSTFWIEYRIWGLKPFGYHLTNVLLHAVNVILLWIVLRRLTILGAWFAAAIFAVHPVHVESVTWVIERKDVLSGMFYLLAFWAYTSFEGRRNWRTYAVALLLFVCAMLSKSITVSMPLVILLWLCWKRERLQRRDLLPVLPFLVVAATIATADVWYGWQQKSIGLGLSFIDKCLIAGRALWFYALKLIWPLNLMAIYPRWDIDSRVWWQYVFPCAVAAVLIILWLQRKRLGKGPLVAVLFFSLTSGPTLGFIDFSFMEISFVADRFQYLASIGLITLFAAFVTRSAERLALQQVVVGLLISAIIVLLTLTTISRNKVWKDDFTLWSDCVAKSPGNIYAHYNLAKALEKRGLFDKAQSHYLRVLKTEPKNVNALINLSHCYMTQKKLAEARECLDKALSIAPNNSFAYNNLGTLWFMQGEMEKAIENYHRAVELNSENAQALFNLGYCLEKTGREDLAITYYQKALEAKPNYEKPRQRLRVLRQVEH